MAIACPYCRYSITVKNPKPGRFKLKCPKCAGEFRLIVANDEARTTSAEPLPQADASVVPQPGVAQDTARPDVSIAPQAGAFQTLPPPSNDSPSFVVGEETMPPSTQESPSFVVGEQTRMPLAHEPADFSVGGGSAEETGMHFERPEPPPERVSWHSPTMAEGDRPSSAEMTRTQIPSGQYDPQVNTIAPAPEVAAKAPAEPAGPTKMLGGYRLVKELGRGGMGSVYLARQVSLDRDVALKLMNPSIARDAAYLARFTREAYAAAQLVHHNVVQIYDIGESGGTHFFSMEFVRGRSLGDLAKKEGPVDLDAAVGYILQAARGLKFAHDRGMIHRDIKPDNLMLNDQGVVKVADLGLVKLPGLADPSHGPAPAAIPKPGQSRISDIANTELTNMNVAMGTPAYMAPEQASDAATVDHRADIYSLGCTFYVLITGRPLFTGASALEVMSKHITEPVVPPDVVVSHVPKDLSAIILKMVAKKAEDRYADLGEVIRVLEEWQGKNSAGGFGAREEHVAALEECVRSFQSAPTARLRTMVLSGFFGLCALVVLVSLPWFTSWGWWVAASAVELAAVTGLTYLIARSTMVRSHLLIRVREFVLGSSLADWLSAGAGLLIAVLAAWVLNLLGIALAVAVVGVGIGLALPVILDRNLAEERRESLHKAEQLLKRLRVRGMDEEALRLFVATYGGTNWEEFFEALFGYEAKRSARLVLVAQGGVTRSTYAAWRDPLLDWIEGRQQARKAARERHVLQDVERRALRAQGLDEAAAREQAELAAELMVEQAAAFKAEEPAATDKTSGGGATAGERGAAKPRNVREMVRAAEQVRNEPKRARKPADPLAPVKMFVGARARFLAGAGLLVVTLLWVQQNRPVFEQLQVLGQQLAQARTPEAVQAISEQLNAIRTTPFLLPLFNGFAPAAAGLMLVISSFLHGRRVWLGLVPGAAAALFGSAILPALGPIPADQVAFGVGVGVAGYGLRMRIPKYR